MESLRGEKILVTGPAGQIAFPLASRLAGDNEVWGIARFRDPRTRERVEAAGIQTRAVDLADPDWADLPDDFGFVLHLAASIAPGHDYDESLRVNAQGTGRLMSRFRSARACLVMSTCGVYASPEDPHHAIVESDPLGGTPQPYSPTYCVSKIGEEAVARFAAREFELPTTIARMNVAYGGNGGYPAMLLEMILTGDPIPLLPDRASLCSPIHEHDIIDHTPRLLAAASIPATITNWGGDEAVEVPELCRYMAELVGKQAEFVRTPEGIHQYRLDPTRRTELAGPCGVSWRDGLRRMIAFRHPELRLRGRASATPGTG
jgi:nucleoside-diphosphate-sugar epimerase